MPSIEQRIAEELSVHEQQIAAAVRLLDEGATVPFIARYRKEVTGGLDDIQLRALDQRLHYLRELEERRSTVLKSIREQGRLTPDLWMERATGKPVSTSPILAATERALQRLDASTR